MLGPKFEDYFARTGISMRYFAKEIGAYPEHVHNWVKGKRPIPQKYWKKIVKQSGGAITLCDLLDNFMKDSDEINVSPGKTPDTCIVSLK